MSFVERFEIVECVTPPHLGNTRLPNLVMIGIHWSELSCCRILFFAAPVDAFSMDFEDLSKLEYGFVIVLLPATGR